MRRWIAVFGLVGLACGGCFGVSDEAEADEAAIALRDRVRDADYRSWSRLPGFDEAKPSAQRHGALVDIFINARLADAIEAGPPWPVGSVLVKDGFRQSGAPLSLAMMERREDGWFFAQFDARDRLISSGQPELCLGCHDPGAQVILGLPGSHE